mmetsp:Transcript_35005/g.76749  ORF Transcript_35005/g.76749 Transcript_35005/m.76749 type:complete len:81 (+) Transcript_35005:230-472(+)
MSNQACRYWTQAFAIKIAEKVPTEAAAAADSSTGISLPSLAVSTFDAWHDGSEQLILKLPIAAPRQNEIHVSCNLYRSNP